MVAICIVTEVLRTFTSILAIDLTRYIIGAGGVYLVVNMMLSAKLRKRKIRDSNPPKGQIGREIRASLRTVAIFAVNGTFVVTGAKLGLFEIYPTVSDRGWLYLIFSTVFLIVAHDAWFYWTHRLLHRPAYYRRFHHLHHRSNNPTPFTSYSFDAGEAAINAFYLPIALLIIPVHPLAILIFVSHMVLRNALGHSGYEVFPANRQGQPLLDWMTTVTHHDLHHAHAGYNLGLYFTWWDRLMGTEHPDYKQCFARVTQFRTDGDCNLDTASGCHHEDTC